MENGEELVVLITGCSVGGIGHALAVAFAGRRCRVVATSRRLSSMEGLDSNPWISLEELDVLSDDCVNDVVRRVVEKYGRIDVLVNNAGVQCVGPLVELPLKSIENTFNTNVYGPLRLVQAVTPHMISRKQGKIVNVGSVVAFAPTPWAGAYAGSKAAIHAMNDALRLEMKTFNIDVITLAPGAIVSNIANNVLADYEKLPEWKFFKSQDQAIKNRALMSQGPKSIPSHEFAEKSVNIILKKSPPAMFSYGYHSTMFTTLYYLPLFVRDLIYRWLFKC